MSRIVKKLSNYDNISKMALLKNKKGQVTVEYILLAVALVTLFQISVITLRNNQSLKNFQELPGQIFRNLVENGNWLIDMPNSRLNHPNHHERHYTPEGKGPK